MRVSEVRHGAGDNEGARQELQGSCTHCTACCSYLRLQVSPAYKEEDVRRWIELHGIRLKEMNGGLFAYIPMPCSALKDGRCSIYEERPDVCRSWPTSQADIDDLHDYKQAEMCTLRFSQEV